MRPQSRFKKICVELALAVFFTVASIAVIILIRERWEDVEKLSYPFSSWVVGFALLTCLACILFWVRVTDSLRGIEREQSELVGVLNRRWHDEVRRLYGTDYRYYIEVGEETFEVSREIYDSLLEGYEVRVRYWPHARVANEVDIIKEGRASLGESRRQALKQVNGAPFLFTRRIHSHLKVSTAVWYYQVTGTCF